MTGDELKRLRIEAGMTQAALATKARTTITSISQWECGRRPIPSLVAKGLAVTIKEYREKGITVIA